MINNYESILITGASGALGSEIVSLLNTRKQTLLCPSSSDLDLTSQKSIDEYFQINRINSVIHCASIVGGIAFNIANRYEMAHKNSLININILDACHRYDVPKLITMGSSCCYPINSEKPYLESSYKPGILEETNLNYALTKILLAEAIRAHNDKFKTSYKTVILCNLFSPPKNAKFDRLHLINAIINKMINYKPSESIVIGGSGKPRREFLDTFSAANFITLLLEEYDNSPEFINCGNLVDYSVDEYYKMIAKIFGISPEYEYDSSIPDGVLSKKLNIERALGMGWEPIPLVSSLTSLIKKIS